MWKNVNKLYRASLLLVVLLVMAMQATAQPSVESITEVSGGVELTVTNSDEFYVGALPFVLKIGDKTFSKSRHPDNGDIHTLIFLIPSEVFAQLEESAAVDLGYGRVEVVAASSSSSTALSKPSFPSEAGKRQWSLGGLNKQQLESN